MKQKPLFWQLFPSVCLIVLISLLALSFLAYGPINDFLVNKSSEDLESRLQIAKQLLAANSIESNNQAWNSLNNIGPSSQTRFSLIDSNGKLMADTELDSKGERSLVDLPEVVEALNSGQGQSMRRSQSNKEITIFRALSFKDLNDQTWILRAAVSQKEIRREMSAVYLKVAIGGLLILIVIGIVSFFLSRRLSRPLEQMKIQAERIAKGDFSGRVHLNPHDTFEAHKLGQAMNDISVQLDHRIVTILNQKNERDAILSSMVEGVIAVDPNEKIVHFNEAAGAIFSVSREEVVGKSIQEAIRIPEIQSMVSLAIKKELPEQSDLEIEIKGKTKVLNIQSSPLRSANSKKLGAVFVVEDITQLRSLELHRSEFVANVSHELRTPLTSIRGFAETLLSSEVDKEQSQKFLEIIFRHAKRLGEIIEDLLALSRLEKDQESIDLHEEPLWPSLQAAKEVCDMKASKLGVEISLIKNEGIQAPINPPLLEQAVVNLIDNAMKYSSKGQKVEVALDSRPDQVVISVRDQGSGISKEHLPRLFERFYRIDKARSRQLGGTGLGLSIVKHVALAHRGQVKVESQVGEGSTFQIILPKDNQLTLI